MKKLVVVLAVTLAGCAGGGRMYNENVTQAQADRDTAQCKYEARVATANLRSGLEAGFMQNDLYISCMEARGYRLVQR